MQAMAGGYRRRTIRFAADSHVQLIDGEKLMVVIKNVQIPLITRQPRLEEAMQAKTTEAAAPACPKCGGSMVQRTARKGSRAGQLFWGCEKYPACRGVRASGH